MPLGTEVGLGPGHIVIDGDPAPPIIRGRAPIFGPGGASVHKFTSSYSVISDTT